MTQRRIPISIEVNGAPYEVDVPPGHLLVDTLRYELGLKIGRAHV